jgi:ABC-type transport system involved in multi-copper enzyme maturation permease subunit
MTQAIVETTPSFRARLVLWRAQVLRLARGELGRVLSPLSGFWLYFLAGMPVLIGLGHVIFSRHCALESDVTVMAVMMHVYFLRMALFFACLGVFTRLFRGEMAGRTLHYLFLAPLRREVLVVGKYVGATLGVAAVFGMGFTATFALLHLHHGAEGWAYVFHGRGLGALGAYLLTLTLASVGYGAIFLTLGLLLRNPAIPGLALLILEIFSGVLPSWLQRLTVIFYLKPLLPIAIPEEGPGALFSVVVEPVAWWLAVGGLLLFAASLVALSCWRARRLEINYSTD